jgi:hypothetical protein
LLAVELIKEAVKDGARLFKACEVLDISVRTYYRWKSNPNGDMQVGVIEGGVFCTPNSGEMKSINIERNDFHGEWNYCIKPNL